MIKVQNSLLASNVSLSSIQDASFVESGANVVVLGPRLDTRNFASSIHTGIKKAGRKLSVVVGDSDIHDTVRDNDPELTADLLLIADRRASDLGGKPKGAYHADLLERRVALGRSSIILAETMPIDWESDNFLGKATFETAARLGLGILLNPRKTEQRPFFDRVLFPDNTEQQNFHSATGVVSIGWLRDKRMYEHFGITDSVRPWSWINLHQPR